jgi:hypothetical protein
MQKQREEKKDNPRNSLTDMIFEKNILPAVFSRKCLFNFLTVSLDFHPCGHHFRGDATDIIIARPVVVVTRDMAGSGNHRGHPILSLLGREINTHIENE